MAITAAYVNTTSFTVSGNQTTKFRKGQALTLYQGPDGNAECNVVSSSYSAGTGLTTVTILQAYARAGLATVTRGLTYAEDASSNITRHDHVLQGGPIPAASLIQAEIDELQALPADFAALESDLEDHTTTDPAPHAGHATLDTGLVPDAELGTGTPDETMFLRGDRVWTQILVSPDWCPPPFSYKDADEIYVWPGRFFKGGYRFKGQYQNLAGLATYWDVASKLSVDIDGVYSAGVTSGMLGGKVNSSWYQVYMMGNTANDFLVLPFVRVKAIAYGAPSTTINPGDHATGASYEDGFITAADQWNTYRLVKLDMEDPTTDGNVYEVADTTDGTHDGILITGDVTGEIAAGDWLQLVPPSGVDCVYIGWIRIHSDGSLRWFIREGFNYRFAVISVNGTLNTTPANTDLSSAVPPNAMNFTGDVYVGSEATTAYSVNVVLYNQAGSVVVSEYVNLGSKPDYLRFKKHILWNFDATARIKNAFILYDGVGKAALLGSFEINGIKE